MKKLKLNIVWKTWNLKFVKLLRNPRKRKKILAILLIFALLIPLAIYFNPGEAEAAWFDDSYAYRKKITITNNGSAQTDHTVQVVVDTATLVTDGKLQSDCDDVRFTNINGKLLNHFTEVGCNTAKTVFFVTGDTIQATSSIIYFYYGNPAASAASKFTELPEGVNYGNGGDGAITISSNTNINTANSISGRSCADGGDAVNYSVTASVAAAATSVTLSSTPSAGCLAANDEVLIINLQGTSSDNSNVGKYETARITAISTATLTLNHALINAYDGTTQKIMVQRIPNYTNVTVNSGINFTATAWNGTKGGVMAFRADGTVTVTGNIVGSQLGYKNGLGAANGPCWSNICQPGESYNGQPAPSSGAPANLGGGKPYINGGGGGGYGSAGGAGSTGAPSASGGATYGNASLSTLFLGSGGGTAGDDATTRQAGGIILIGASTLTVSGSVANNGANGCGGRCSGGGSGGSTMIKAATATLGSSLVTASGGAVGGSSGNYGGAGGDGRIHVDYSTTSGSTTPTADTSTVPVVGSFASEEKAPSPAAYWKFDEGQGTNAQDSTTNNNDGTITGATWQTKDMCISENCMFFDGSDDVATVTNANPLDFDVGLAGGVTFAGWVRVNSDGEASVGEIFNKGTNTYMRITNEGSDGLADLEAKLDLATTDATATVTNGITLNRWHHVAFGYTDDGDDEITVYIDGVSRATSTNGDGSPASSDTNNLLIGGTSTANFHGFIDEFKVYDFERTESEIKADFAKRGGPAGASAVLGASSSEAFLSEGLVGYWKMNETAANSCTGAINDSCDSSGNGNDIAWQAGATNTSGKFGNGLIFNGTNYACSQSGGVCADNTNLAVKSDGFTASAWIYRTGDPGNYLILNYGNAYWYLRAFGNGDGTGDIQFTVNSGATQIGASMPSKNQWAHVVGVYDGTSISLYINGELKAGPTSTTITTTTGRFSVGNNIAGNQGFVGSADDVRIYNRALSPSEVEGLYNWAPGPVLHYNFDENTGTGSNVLIDRTGNGRNGTTNGSMTNDDWVPGKYGSALDFDGTDDYVSISSSPDTSTGDLTMEAWVKLPKVSDVYSGANENWWSALSGSVALGNSTTFLTIGTRLTSGTHGHDNWTFQVPYNNGGNAAQAKITAGGAPSANTWYHVAGTLSGSTMTLYVNGAKITSGTVNNRLSANSSWKVYDLRLCCGSTNLGTPAVIDDARYYNYARTQKQIIEDMNAGHPAPGSPVGSSIAHWKMDDMQGTTAQDSTDNNNDLTLSAASWTASGKMSGAWNGTGARWLTKTDDSDFNVSATDSYAVSLWIKSDAAANPGATEYLFNKANATTAGYGLYANTSGQICFGIDDDTSWGPDISSCSPTSLYDASWHHVLAVRDVTADKTLIYIDGILRDSDTDTTTATLANSLSLYVGDRDGTDNGDEFNGDIDEVKVFRFALTADEAKVEANAGSSAAFGGVLGSSEASDLSDGAGNPPVAHYNFNENKDNTCAGGVNDVCDISGNANDGAKTNMEAADWVPVTDAPVWSNGLGGSTLDFDGSNEEVDLGNPTDLQGTSSHTITAWVKPDRLPTASGTNHAIFIKGDDTPADGWGMGLALINNSGVDRFNAAVITTNPSLTQYNAIGGTPSAGSWAHVAGVFDNSAQTITLYINGVQAAQTNTGATLRHANESHIGIWADGDIPFDGQIDGVKIYNYARTQAQVSYLYNRGGPIGWWKFDECQGTTAYDSSGKGNNGTITIGGTGDNTSVGTCSSGTGTEAWNNGTTGKLNYSLDFDGADDYVTTGNILNPSSGDFSAMTWVNLATEADSGDSQTILQQEGTNGRSWLYRDVNDNKISSFLGGAATQSTGTFGTGSWHHVGVTVSGTTVQLYLDGKADGSSTQVIESETSGMRIGAHKTPSATAEEWNGQIDDVRIYNYTLSQSQISYLYNRGGPIGWWKFDECQGTTAYDSSGKGNNGTITPGAGTNTSAGTCGSGNGNEMWDNGTTGKLNYSLDFDNADDYVDIGTGPTSVNSVSFWVNPTTTTEYFVNLTGTTDYIWSNAGTVTATGFSSPTIYVNGQVSSALTAGTWQHVTVVTATAENASNLDIGRTADANYMDGQIDDVRIYNYALSQAQIRKIMNESAQRFGPSTGSP